MCDTEGKYRSVVLVIGGWDGSGGAGIAADLRMVERLGGYGLAALTALTVQDHCCFDSSVAIQADWVGRQISWLLDHYPVRAIKLGMLAGAEVALAAAKALRTQPGLPLVLDPVLRSSSGGVLLDEAGYDVLCSELMPMACLITPNRPEAQVILGPESATLGGDEIAKRLKKRLGVPILLKGGHTDDELSRDILVDETDSVTYFDGPRIHSVNSHGTGCRLASAIATGLSQGMKLPQAMARAKETMNDLFLNPIYLEGLGPVLG